MEAKRVFDVAVSSVALVAGAPVWLTIAAVVWIDSRAPVIHRATRTGRQGRPFEMLKFRTMTSSAGGPGITRAGDARVTRCGAVLRRFRLDEVPQLINVLRGEMSMVGPRPEDPRYVALYTDRQRMVLTLRPGIASAASIRYRNEAATLARSGADWEEAYVSQVLPDKLRMELDYVDEHSVLTDVVILARAVACVITTGAGSPAATQMSERTSGTRKAPIQS